VQEKSVSELIDTLILENEISGAITMQIRTNDNEDQDHDCDAGIRDLLQFSYSFCEFWIS
jgi:hypothetical protein